MYARNAFKTSGFTYSASGPFTKSKERIRKFKETRDTSYIYKNDMAAYGEFEDLTKRTIADKVLRNKAFKIASDQKYD